MAKTNFQGTFWQAVNRAAAQVRNKRYVSPSTAATRNQPGQVPIGAVGRFWHQPGFIEKLNADRAERGELEIGQEPSIKLGERLYLAPDGRTPTTTSVGKPLYVDKNVYTTVPTGVPAVYKGTTVPLMTSTGIAQMAVKPWTEQVVTSSEPTSLTVVDPFSAKVPVDLNYATGKGRFWWVLDSLNTVRNYMSAVGSQTALGDLGRGAWAGLTGMTQGFLYGAGNRPAKYGPSQPIPVMKSTGDRIPRGKLKEIPQEEIEWVPYC